MLYVEPAGWDMSVRENLGNLFKRSCSIEVVKSLGYIHTYLELHISRLHMKYTKTFSPTDAIHMYVCMYVRTPAEIENHLSSCLEEEAPHHYLLHTYHRVHTCKQASKHECE